MNNLCKKYLRNVKVFFPIMGKQERKYLENLELNVNDFCAEKSLTSLEDLYKDFGTPSDVANSYFSSANIDYILKQIRRTKAIKTALVTLIVSALLATSICCTILYSSYKVFKSEQIFSEDTFIK